MTEPNVAGPLGVDGVAWNEQGLAPAVVQDARTGEVLTLAWMNRESLARTLETKETWFWSRSRGELWHKGGTSGNTQLVVGLTADCDQDALVVKVVPAGPACHTGAQSCFHREVAGAPAAAGSGSLGAALDALVDTVARRKQELPTGSYTTYLFEAGLDKVLKKVGEEAAEVLIASKNPDDAALAGEIGDLLYHLTVLMAARGLDPRRVADVLNARRKPERPKPSKPS
jgi:phosphoribosyl-AMP cyclohydrolase / phosphoribosyl-ATP pyrophosphohydrolase